MIVKERKKVINYIKKRQIASQYLKAKKHLESDRYDVVDFKQRKPRSSRIYQFRITQKYRAFGHFVEDVFIIFNISDHQD
tara:strand:+ start:747 stop:986 length:240 start_codon:yes stop_codon:yes gene_type:complete